MCNIGNFNSTALSDTIDLSDASCRKKIRHLYRRIGYGARLEDFDFIQNLVDAGQITNFSDLVDKLIDDAAGLEMPAEFDWVDRLLALPKKTSGGKDKETHFDILSNYWMNEFIQESIRSKLMLFWRGHFATDTESISTFRGNVYLRYYKILHDYAFGNFKEFVKKIGLTPNMLMYLNGARSVGESQGDYVECTSNGTSYPPSDPNENYARELLELFTMGITGPNNPNDGEGEMANYQQTDINELSKVLTGWRIGSYTTYGDNYKKYMRPFILAVEDVNTGELLGTLEDYSEKDTLLSLIDSGEARLTTEYPLQYGHHDWKNKTVLGQPIDLESKLDEVFAGAANSNSNNLPGALACAGSYTYNNTGSFGAPLESSNYPTATTNIDSYIYNDYRASYTRVAGRAYITAAVWEYDEVHDILFEQRELQIAYFICKKLYDFYVYGGTEVDWTAGNYHIGNSESTTPKEFVMKLVDVFRTNWDINAVLKKLFKSEHFYDDGVIGTQIKSHVGSAISLFRKANLQPEWSNGSLMPNPEFDYTYRMTLLDPNLQGNPASPDNDTYYGGIVNAMTGEGATEQEAEDAYNRIKQSDTIYMQRACAVIGHNLHGPPDVSGWAGHRAWLTEDVFVKRRKLLGDFITEKFAPHTKEKFRQLAIRLMDEEEDVTGMNFIQKYADPERVIRIMWKHFFSVPPQESSINGNPTGQVVDAIKVYGDSFNYPMLIVKPEDNNFRDYLINNVGFPPAVADIKIDELKVEMASRITNVILYFTQQPEWHLT